MGAKLQGPAARRHMKIFLRLQSGLFEDLTAHLLPIGGLHEQAAFLFVSKSESVDQINFDVLDTVKLVSDDFESQYSDYLELADNTWSKLIKHAHNLNASLVEIHSHLTPNSAEFSYADYKGLKETVPYIWWRLANRPYLAIVITNNGFDALVWLDDPNTPKNLDGLLVGDHQLCPTNYSIGRWK